MNDPVRKERGYSLVAAVMNDVESKGVESLFQEVSVLEKEFKSILDRQTPYAVDVLTLLKKYQPLIWRQRADMFAGFVSKRRTCCLPISSML